VNMYSMYIEYHCTVWNISIISAESYFQH
jgi:hypothetical protein